jgi:hypothetical protein
MDTTLTTTTQMAPVLANPYANTGALSTSATQLLLGIAIALAVVGFVCAEEALIRRFFNWLIRVDAHPTSA